MEVDKGQKPMAEENTRHVRRAKYVLEVSSWNRWKCLRLSAVRDTILDSFNGNAIPKQYQWRSVSSGGLHLHMSNTATRERPGVDASVH